MSEREKLPPNYAKLEVALRSIGYSFEAAVADIVDNSLDASARSVLIRLITTRGHPMDLAIWDDGCGMSSSTLMEAMRFGADVRQEINRLGKFGLGLKLASLSQCRELRVYSSKDGKLSGRGWLEEGIRNEFTCEIYTAEESRAAVEAILPDHQWRSGTLVLWSHLYRVGHSHTDVEEHAQKLLTRLRSHLALAFHRFLSGKKRKKVAISLDIFDADAGTEGLPLHVEPLDPFGYAQSGHKDFPCELTVSGHYSDRIGMVAHVWPPNSDVPNYKLPGGANSRQGFYFYRNDRLIQGGGWNGIRESEPHLSLARLEIDMAPDFDVEVSLDVKKVEIHLPAGLVQAIQGAKNGQGVDFKKYLALADSAYRTRKITDAELPLIPSTGLPAKLSEFLHAELRIKATSRHRDLKIEWAPFTDDAFFDFDRDEGRLYLNQDYRRQLMHGLPGSSADIPVVKCLLFLLLRDAIMSQRTGSKIREHIDQLNRILVESVKHERVRQ
jgi:hypothetical protein